MHCYNLYQAIKQKGWKASMVSPHCGDDTTSCSVVGVLAVGFGDTDSVSAASEFSKIKKNAGITAEK